MPLGKTPAEIVKDEADTCMAVLQGFVLGRYGEAVVAQGANFMQWFKIKMWTEVFKDKPEHCPRENELDQLAMDILGYLEKRNEQV